LTKITLAGENFQKKVGQENPDPRTLEGEEKGGPKRCAFPRCLGRGSEVGVHGGVEGEKTKEKGVKKVSLCF